MKKYISIFSHKIARRLLKEGFLISDIKPHRDTNETIFVFRNEGRLMDVVNRVR